MRTSNDIPSKAHVALTAAGFKPGQRHAHSLLGDTLAEAIPGYLLKVARDYADDSQMGEAGFIPRVMVDHQGPGQKAAVARYVEVLRAAGLTVELRPVARYRTKLVAWVMDPLHT